MSDLTFRDVTNANPIKVAREKLELTATDLGRMLDTDINKVTRWERGYEPPREMWEPIAKALGVDPDELKKEYKAWLG